MRPCCVPSPFSPFTLVPPILFLVPGLARPPIRAPPTGSPLLASYSTSPQVPLARTLGSSKGSKPEELFLALSRELFLVLLLMPLGPSLALKRTYPTHRIPSSVLPSWISFSADLPSLLILPFSRLGLISLNHDVSLSIIPTTGKGPTPFWSIATARSLFVPLASLVSLANLLFLSRHSPVSRPDGSFLTTTISETLLSKIDSGVAPRSPECVLARQPTLVPGPTLT